MILSLYSSLIVSSCLCAQLLVSPLAAQATNVEVTLEPGQRLTLVLPNADSSTEAVQEQYLAGTFAVASQYGFAEQHSFAISEVLVGEEQLEALGIYSWPDAKSAQIMRNDPQVKKLAPLRAQGWHEMHIVDVDIDKPQQLRFASDKRYTFAVVWIKDEVQYERYLQATEPQREAMGAKVIFIAPVAEFDAIHPVSLGSPNRVVIVEWPANVTPKSYLESPLFLANETTVQAAIARIDWYQLRHWGGY